MGVLEETAAKLSPVEWQAVKAAGKGADGSRSELEVGEHEVDMLLRIKGAVSVGHDGETRRTLVPSAVDVLAWVLSSDLLTEDLRQRLVIQMRESAERSSGCLPEVEEGYVAQATMAIAAVSPSVKASRKGSVRGTLRVGVVSTAQLTDEVSGAIDRSTRLIALE